MLAEKYRPKDFSEVIGQSKIVKTLQWTLNQSNPIGPVVLLSGPSGSGKTTLAYCAARYWGCSEWDIRKIESAEADISALREISQNMWLCGAGHRGRKCYIIDEIHTITGRAQDRLLSLFEELRPHCLLVGTTTESEWAGPTLFSRFTRLSLAKPSSAEVSAYIETIAQKEGLPIPTDTRWAEKMVKYNGLNIRDLLNQLPSRLFDLEPEAAEICAA